MQTPLPSTSELIKKYQLNTKKSLGQNFILDKNFTDKIARSACAKSGFVKINNFKNNDLNHADFVSDNFKIDNDLSQFEILEIGAGPGGLTRSILDCGAKKLIVIEKDDRCILALKELQQFYGERLEIIAEDALKIDETKIFNSNNKFKIIANLPYNIGTLLIFKWLKILPKIESMHLMLQKEVVQRIVARVGENHYGRLAVMINFLCDTKMLFKVNPAVFSPPPKVESAIVEIVPNPEKLLKYSDGELIKLLEIVVAEAFGMRRKMLKSALKNYLSKLEINPENFLKNLDINPNCRAEEITIEQFYQIARAIKTS